MSFRSKKKKKAIDTVGERLKITGGETRRPSEMQVPMGKDEVGKKKKRKGMYFDSISIRKSSTNKYEEKNYSYVRHEAKRK